MLRTVMPTEPPKSFLSSLFSKSRRRKHRHKNRQQQQQQQASLIATTSTTRPVDDKNKTCRGTSNGSTETVLVLEQDDTSFPVTKTTTSQRPRAHTKTVRFNERVQVISSALTHKHDNIQDEEFWYTEDELHLFRLQNGDLIRTLRIQHRQQAMLAPEHRTWTSHLRRMHQTFCAGTDIVHQTSVSIDSTVVAALVPLWETNHLCGVERWAVPSMVHDTLARRRQLSNLVLHRTHPETLREACRYISQPSRLVARFVAQQQHEAAKITTL